MIDLKPITEQPAAVLENVRQMRNAVREWMYSDHVITEQEHAAWIDRLRTDDTQRVMVAFILGEVIGVANLYRIQLRHATATWGYYLDPNLKGKGYGRALASRIISYAFDECGIEKLNGETLENNHASVQVDLKLGMRIEGVQRSAIVKNGERINIVQLGITAEEFRARQQEEMRELYIAPPELSGMMAGDVFH